MTGALVPNALLRAGDTGASAVLDHIGARPPHPLDAAALTVLEALIHDHDLDEAGDRARRSLGADVTGEDRVARGRAALGRGLVLASARGLHVLPSGLDDREGQLTLTRLSERSGGVLRALFGAAPPPPEALAPPAFAATVGELMGLGLIAPAPGAVDWGDLRRPEPLCQAFGMGRGTAVDRHYLARFVDEVRPLIVGDVVDVGGSRADRVRLRLEGTTSFRVLDVADRPHVDVVGDVHDPALLAEGSCDSILLLNVLEHCRDPRAVVANARSWLRPGGRCFVSVPSAQRLHDAPDDYWRFTAAGLRVLFEGWTAVRASSYGSLATVLASYAGIAAEELAAEDLDAHRVDFPVATCAVAQK